MSTTCSIDNQTGENLYLLTTPDPTQPDAEAWGSRAYHLDNTCVGAGDRVDVVTLNREEQIKDDRCYYMKTEVQTQSRALICTLTERVKGTLLKSKIAFKIESGDGKAKTDWVKRQDPPAIKFTLAGKNYQVTPKWISRLGFDDLEYTLTELS